MGKKQKIGWIGLGKMGEPMSKRLMESGYPLSVYDIDKGQVRKVTARGAQAADSLRTLAADVDVLISMILNDSVLKTVSIGPEGAFKGAKAGTIYIDMSTVSPDASSHVAVEAERKGIKFLRAPVSGSTSLAAKGALTIFASGPKDAYDKCSDIFDAMGQKIFYVGTGEEGRHTKLFLNIMVAIISAMTAEALTFGERGGLDWNQMIEIMNNSVVASPLIRYKSSLLKERDFTPAFTANQLVKDLDIVLDAGKAMNVALPVTSLIRQFFGSMQATGRGELDFFGLLTLMEEMSGIKSQIHKK